MPKGIGFRKLFCQVLDEGELLRFLEAYSSQNDPLVAAATMLNLQDPVRNIADLGHASQVVCNPLRTSLDDNG